MNGIIRTASYLRVSSQRQAEEKTIQSQLADVRARILRDGLTIDSPFEYIDDGYSGTTLLRPALERLRDHVAASLIDRLYIHCPDRLARKLLHQSILLEEMTRYGCEVIFLNQDGLPDSPEAKLLVQMQGMFAEYEREKILERTRRGRRHSATQGKISVFGRAPYGYRYIRRSASEKAARWEIEPTESQTVRLMFELVGERGSSLAAVVRQLKLQGISTKNGNATWDRATIRGILNNPAYFGEARYGKMRLSQRKPGRRAKRGDPGVPRQAKVAVATPLAEQIMIPVPALISKSLFEEVRERMEDNGKRQRERQDGPKYLLSGLLICGKCGAAYCHQRGGNHHYYRCIGGDKYRHPDKSLCDNTAVKAGEIEKCVWQDLCGLLADPTRLLDELNRRQSVAPENTTSMAKQQSKVDGLRVRLDRMIDAYSQGLIEQSEFESRIVALRSQHAREAAALASLCGEQVEATDSDTLAQALIALAAQVGENLETASQSLKRELLTLLISRIEVCEIEIRIVYKVPPNPFVQSPVNLGNFQHCLSLQKIAPGERRELQASQA